MDNRCCKRYSILIAGCSGRFGRFEAIPDDIIFQLESIIGHRIKPEFLSVHKMQP